MTKYTLMVGKMERDTVDYMVADCDGSGPVAVRYPLKMERTIGNNTITFKNWGTYQTVHVGTVVKRFGNPFKALDEYSRQVQMAEGWEAFFTGDDGHDDLFRGRHWHEGYEAAQQRADEMLREERSMDNNYVGGRVG